MIKRLTTGLAGAAIACTLLAGCSSNSPSAVTTTSAPSHATSSLPGTTTIPYSAKLNARTDVSTSSCNQVNGAWVMKGSVTNSAKKNRNYQIVVDFVTNPGNTVMDTQIINVRDVAPKATKSWTATGAQGKDHLGCVVRQVQI
jgi:hypothetical protein